MSKASSPNPIYKASIEAGRQAGHLVAGGGRLLAMKGRYPVDEVTSKLNGWKVVGVHRLAVPGLDDERHLVELCRSHVRTEKAVASMSHERIRR